MSDFLAGLADRALGSERAAASTVRPRPVSRFERQAPFAGSPGLREEAVEVEGGQAPRPAERGAEHPRFTGRDPVPAGERPSAPARPRSATESLPLPASRAEAPLPRREPGQPAIAVARAPAFPAPPHPRETDARGPVPAASDHAEVRRTIVERLVRDDRLPAPAPNAEREAARESAAPRNGDSPEPPPQPGRAPVQPRIEVMREPPGPVMPRREERGPAGEASPQPIIHVSIGRIEVRAAPPSARPAAKASPAPPTVEPLEEYLRNRRARP